jgi:hypothetical protein
MEHDLIDTLLQLGDLLLHIDRHLDVVIQQLLGLWPALCDRICRDWLSGGPLLAWGFIIVYCWSLLRYRTL